MEALEELFKVSLMIFLLSLNHNDNNDKSIFKETTPAVADYDE